MSIPLPNQPRNPGDEIASPIDSSSRTCLKDSEGSMSGHVFVVSEWLPKENYEQELWIFLKELMALTKKTESACVRAHVTRQISHPCAPGKSKYKIILLQEYVDIKAFDLHCQADYVKSAFKKYVENEETSMVKDWSCRLFSEDVQF